MIAVIDNYDSFTYNLVQYVGECRRKVHVFRNDDISVERLTELKPEAVILSPAPMYAERSGHRTRARAGVGRQSSDTRDLFRASDDCPGLWRYSCCSPKLMHGKTSPIYHGGKGMFERIPSPFTATRYHSLTVERETLPACFTVSAWTEDGEIMGIRHKEYPVEGVQFHPESVMTDEGKAMLARFLAREKRVDGATGHVRYPKSTALQTSARYIQKWEQYTALGTGSDRG